MSGFFSRKKKPDAFSAKPYYQRAWRFLRQDLLLLALKLGTKTLTSLLWVAALLGLAGVSIAGVTQQVDQTLPDQLILAQLWQRAAALAGRPDFLMSAAGILGSVWLINTSLDALARAGIWGVLAARASGQHAPQNEGFWARQARSISELSAHALAHFGRVLGLRLLGLAAQATAILLALILLQGVFGATTGAGFFAHAPTIARALLWALPLTTVAAFGILVRLSVEFSSAPLMLEQKSPADALLDGAQLVIRHFIRAYRIFIFAASLLLAPLGLNWLIAMGQAFAPQTPEMLATFGLLRLAGNLVLFAATGIIAVFFRGAIFAFHADLSAPTPPSNAQMNHKKTTPPTGSAKVSMNEQTTLRDFLPEEYPNIVPISALITPRPETPARAPESAALNTTKAPEQPEDLDPTPDEPARPPLPRPLAPPAPDAMSTDGDLSTPKETPALPQPKFQLPRPTKPRAERSEEVADKITETNASTTEKPDKPD